MPGTEEQRELLFGIWQNDKPEREWVVPRWPFESYLTFWRTGRTDPMA